MRGVPPVFLGMSRLEVRNAMGLPFRTFQKSMRDASLTDTYLNSAFQVFYDGADLVEYIELSRGGPFKALYEGVEVFETEAEDLVRFISRFAEYDPNDRELGYSYVFPRLELSVWRPLLPEDPMDSTGRCFSTIGVGKPGYYSDDVSPKTL